MACSSCGPQLDGHFGRIRGPVGEYVRATPAQIFVTTGTVKRAPNETAGMHVNRLTPTPGVSGLGGFETWTNFQPLPTDVIQGVPNGYILIGGIAVLALALMR